jgi:hypothetical protein
MKVTDHSLKQIIAYATHKYHTPEMRGSSHIGERIKFTELFFINRFRNECFSALEEMTFGKKGWVVRTAEEHPAPPEREDPQIDEDPETEMPPETEHRENPQFDEDLESLGLDRDRDLEQLRLDLESETEERQDTQIDEDPEPFGWNRYLDTFASDLELETEIPPEERPFEIPDYRDGQSNDPESGGIDQTFEMSDQDWIEF